MEEVKNATDRGLPRTWRDKVVEKLAEQKISKTKSEVTKIFNGYKKGDPDEKKVLEAILKVKEEYQKEKEEIERLRSSINTAAAV